MPVEQLAIDYDAQEVLDNLAKYNDRTTPTRQGYLFSIAGKKTQLYDLNNTPVSVRVENIEQYIAKGFTTKKQETLQDSGQTKEDRLEELGMNRRHDTVPVTIRDGQSPVVRQSQTDEVEDMEKANEEERLEHEKRRAERDTPDERIPKGLAPVADLDKKEFADIEPPHLTGAGKPTLFNTTAAEVAKDNAEAEEESEKAVAESEKKRATAAAKKTEARTTPSRGSTNTTVTSAPPAGTTVTTNKDAKP